MITFLVVYVAAIAITYTLTTLYNEYSSDFIFISEGDRWVSAIFWPITLFYALVKVITYFIMRGIEKIVEK